MKGKKYLRVLSVILALAGCSQKQAQRVSCFKLNPADFQKTIDGKQTNLYCLHNRDLSAAITNYGGRIVALRVAGRNGEKADVVLK